MSDLDQATETVRYSGALTEEDWVEGGRLAYSRLKVLSRFETYLALVAMITFVLVALITRDPGPTFLFGLLWLGTTIVIRIRAKRFITRQLHDVRIKAVEPSYAAQFESVWDGAGFHTRSTEFDHVRTWKDFRAWREDETYMVVFESACYRVIPKRMLGERAETLRAMFSKHIGKAI